MTNRKSAISARLLLVVLVGISSACASGRPTLAQRQCDVLLSWVAAAETSLYLRLHNAASEETRQAQLDTWEGYLAAQAEVLPTDLASALDLAVDDRPLLDGNGVPSPELAAAVRVVGRYVVTDCGGSARVFSFLYPYWESLDA